MTNRTIAFIFARGGSKGIPRKNLSIIGGKPLVAHSILVALQSSQIHRVIVSTDDPEIARISREYGADVPFLRPAELSQGISSELLAWHHAIQSVYQEEGEKSFDVFVSLPATSPLRSIEDVDACIDLLKTSDADVVLTMRESMRNPYLNMVHQDSEGYVRLVCDSEKRFFRRQDAPMVYDVTTVAYVTRPEFILKTYSLWEGKVRAIHVPLERAVDIDNPLDLEWTRFLWELKRKELDHTQ